MKDYLELTSEDIDDYEYYKYVVDALTSDDYGFEHDLAVEMINNYENVMIGAYRDKCTVEAAASVLETLFDCS